MSGLVPTQDLKGKGENLQGAPGPPTITLIFSPPPKSLGTRLGDVLSYTVNKL